MKGMADGRDGLAGIAQYTKSNGVAQVLRRVFHLSTP